MQLHVTTQIIPAEVQYGTLCAAFVKEFGKDWAGAPPKPLHPPSHAPPIKIGEAEAESFPMYCELVPLIYEIIGVTDTSCQRFTQSLLFDSKPCEKKRH